MFARILAEAVPRTEDASGAAVGCPQSVESAVLRPSENASRAAGGCPQSVESAVLRPLMRRVPEEPVFGTEYLFRTVEACFLHRMPLKMRRVPEEPVSCTECPFRTIGGRFRYRVLSQRQAAAAELRTYKERGRPFSRPLVVLYRHEPCVWNAAQAVELRNLSEIILLQPEL